MTTHSNVTAVVRQGLIEAMIKKGAQSFEPDPSTRLEDLGMGSMDVAELVADLADTLGNPTTAFSDIRTTGDLIHAWEAEKNDNEVQDTLAKARSRAAGRRRNRTQR